MTVRLDVHCDCGQHIDTFYDVIYEKYPFECPNCGDVRKDKWPWKITATVEDVAE